MASFYIPLSGLNADSRALNTIANNLSNMNTTAYKSQKTNFSDLFYQQVGTTGSGNAIQAGGGVQVASNSANFTQGSFDTSGTTSSDVALDGNGFFLVSDGSGVNTLTRNGAFTQSSSGVLQTSDGMSVMGYPTVNGVVDTTAQLTAITIPVKGSVQQPQATTSFSMTTNLDSSAKVGDTVPSQVQVYDSQGKSYEATVTYTKTGTNQWSYSITLPDTLSAAPAVPASATTLSVPSASGAASTVTIDAAASAATSTPYTATLTSSSTVSGTNTAYSYNFGTGGTVNTATNLTITGEKADGTVVTITAPTVTAGETVSTYASDLNTALSTAGIVGVTATATGGVLSITAPTTTATMAGNVVGDVAATTSKFTFNTGGTVDPSTDLTITGQKADGTVVTITAPAVTSGESITAYASALSSALTASGITNVAVSANTSTNQISVVGADFSTANGVKQDLAAATTNYNFGSSSTVDPATNLTITGQTNTGATATITLPTITAGETVSAYASALNTALSNAGIVGVTASAAGGQLSIVGANSAITGTASQDLSATTTSYDFGSSGGTLATVNSGTNLSISGLTTSGTSATITAPTVTSGETVAQYAAALNTALTAAGITGVSVSSDAAGVLSIVGSNITTSGKVIQDPVASANSTGSLTFDSKGNLVSPATDVSNITFSGLTDGAANLNMTWDVLGTNGKSTISQVDSDSSSSGQTQDGYAAGSYKEFEISTDGTVTAKYSNGQTQAVGQLAIADVTNLQGLELLGNGNYATTLASGAASIGVAGNNGLGSVQGSSLEMSNVNISAEFSNLIIAQRGFEANAKAITTFDSVTQQTINMIH